jgi:hypothetical protein
MRGWSYLVNLKGLVRADAFSELEENCGEQNRSEGVTETFPWNIIKFAGNLKSRMGQTVDIMKCSRSCEYRYIGLLILWEL